VVNNILLSLINLDNGEKTAVCYKITRLGTGSLGSLEDHAPGTCLRRPGYRLYDLKASQGCFRGYPVWIIAPESVVLGQHLVQGYGPFFRVRGMPLSEEPARQGVIMAGDTLSGVHVPLKRPSKTSCAIM